MMPNRTLSERLIEKPDDPDLVWYRGEEVKAEMPVPFCCPAISGNRVLTAGYRLDEDTREAPSWRSRADHRYTGTTQHEVKFCPFCGTPLPSLVRKAVLPSPMFVRADPNSDYCGTCNQSDRCECFPPECAWEAEGAPPVFAAVCLLSKLVKVHGKLSYWSFLSVSRKGRPREKGLPGGRVEAGEPPEDAARRELLEETGYVAGPMHKVFDAIDDAKVRVVAFRAQTFSESPLYSPPEGETGVVEWVGMSDLIRSSPFSSFNAALFSLLGIRVP